MNTRGIATEYRMTQWAQVMQERKGNGESVTAFCESRGISKNTYFYWQRKIREAACEQLATSQSCGTHSGLPGFTEVKVARFPALTAGTSQIRIEYGRVQIVLDQTYPPEKLAELVRGLVC